MKKFLYVLGTVLELAALVGIPIVEYFTHAKLGMNRWLGFHNAKWEADLPVAAIEWAVALVLIALFVLALLALVKSAQKRTLAVVSLVLSGVLVVAYVAFIAVASTQMFRDFYLLAILLAIAALMQAIKAVVLCRANSSKPS